MRKRKITATELMMAEEMQIKTEKIREIIRELIRVKNLADSGRPSILNQGQALDGYSELYEYRGLISKLAFLLGYDKNESIKP